MAMRNGWFESNFLTLQGKPKHTSCGYSKSHMCNFSPLFPFYGSGPPSSSTEVHEPRYGAGPWLLLHSPCAHRNNVKTLGGMSMHQFNHVLKITDYHILGMWLVRSKTLPPLPHTATLAFLLNRWSLNHQQKYCNIAPSVGLMILT
jgi:hypothetical protein